ncbi:MAG: hypothetical protein WD872_21640 [Pirellulaceae bacterium]
MNAVDTNVLVYAFDMDEPDKRAKAADLITKLVKAQDAVLLWQVACEFIATMRFPRYGRLVEAGCGRPVSSRAN